MGEFEAKKRGVKVDIKPTGLSTGVTGSPCQGY